MKWTLSSGQGITRGKLLRDAESRKLMRRHDIDRKLPRTPQEIFDLNTMMVDKMLNVIPKDVPIVPSLGNNDIYPHNVLAAGPNRITEHFLG